MKIGLLFTSLLSLPKSVYLNLRSLPFREAMKLPILVHYNTNIEDLSGKVVFLQAPSTFCVKFGFTGSYALGDGGG